ncbi:MAG: hypothetical protein OXT65_05040 [Alphaproteobacteria bacterium]|nr:hypothetical protein [Alphaproteobacteria bacterium]
MNTKATCMALAVLAAVAAFPSSAKAYDVSARAVVQKTKIVKSHKHTPTVKKHVKKHYKGRAWRRGHKARHPHRYNKRHRWNRWNHWKRWHYPRYYRR